MNVPDILTSQLSDLSDHCGVRLHVEKFWKNDFRPGWHCYFRGVVNDSPLLTIQVIGTLSVELDPGREHETDLFVFVNGVRVGKSNAPLEYLWRRGSSEFTWDDQDEGYENWTTLESVMRRLSSDSGPTA